MIMRGRNATRGFGLFEMFLCKKRAAIADNLICEKLRSGRVLDIGCGTTPYFLMDTKFKEKFGIDASIKSDCMKGGGLKLIKSNIVGGVKIPFPDNFFDVVTILAVIEHIKKDDIVGIFREARRVLKRGGRLIITTPNHFTKNILKAMAKLGLVSRVEMSEHKYHYRGAELAGYLKRAGFGEKKIGIGFFEFHTNIYAFSDK